MRWAGVKVILLAVFAVVLCVALVWIENFSGGASVITNSQSTAGSDKTVFSSSVSSSMDDSLTSLPESSVNSEEVSSGDGTSSVSASDAATESQEEKPHVSPWEQRQALISQLDPFQFKAETARNMSVNDWTYSDLLRNIDSHIGEKVMFHGAVKSLTRDQVTSTGLLVCGGLPDYKENFVISFTYDGYPKFIESDAVFLYGVITGTTTYTTNDGESHETFQMDAYFYDMDTGTKNQPLTEEEEKYYYGNYSVYEEGKFRPFQIDASTINGHPYQACDIYKTPDSVYIQLKFTEWPDAYQGKVLNGITDDGLDTILLGLDGSVYVTIHDAQNPDVHCTGVGWNPKYKKPAQIVRLEQQAN